MSKKVLPQARGVLLRTGGVEDRSRDGGGIDGVHPYGTLAAEDTQADLGDVHNHENRAEGNIPRNRNRNHKKHQTKKKI